MTKTIIIVEDDRSTQFVMTSVLQNVAKEAGIQVEVKLCSSRDEALDLIPNLKHDVVSLDMGLPEASNETGCTWDSYQGIDIIKILRVMSVNTPIIIHSSLPAEVILKELPDFPADCITLKQNDSKKRWAEKMVEILQSVK